MGLRWTGLAAFLVSAFFGGIGYALPAEDHPLLKTGALVLSGLALFALIIVLIVAFKRRDRRAQPPASPHIRAKDSPGWKFKRTHALGDQPFAHVDNSPDWSFEDSTIGGNEAPRRRTEEEQEEDPGTG